MYSYDRQAAAQDDLNALTMAYNAAEDTFSIIDDEMEKLHKAQALVDEARRNIKVYPSRAHAFIAAGLHKVQNPQLKTKLWNMYVQIQLNDPDVSGMLDKLRDLQNAIRSAISNAKNEQEWAESRQQRGR